MTQRKLSDNDREDIQCAANAVLQMCDWSLLPEGKEYWDGIYKSLSERAHYGTTDGKPWIEPELTDEDALRRPWVKVKDSEEQSWSAFLVKLVYVKPAGSMFRFSAEDPNDDHAILEWNYCRRATPEEIEAANVR